MEFRALGPVEIFIAGRNVLPTAPKPRQVMSLLMLRRNGVVRAADIADELWEGAPPSSAATTLQTYVYKLRKALMEHGAEGILATRPGGYVLTIPDAATDLHRFNEAVRTGRTLLDDGDATAAATVLCQALDLWRGPALADVVHGRLLSTHVAELEEARTRALELRLETELRLGRHRELLSELKSLALTQPLHEHLHALLMVALHRSGRRNEALNTYRAVRRNMIEQLGLEPGAELQRLHQEILSASRAGLSAVSPALPAGVVPLAQTPVREVSLHTGLPAAAHDFIGRKQLLEDLATHLTHAREHTGDGPATVAISGIPGVGKTALAVELAQRLRPRFPDGQLYAAIGTSHDPRTEVALTLERFLAALGTHSSRIPDDLQGRARLLRRITADRRVLVVVDDISSLSAVRPLLSLGPNCAVLVASRIGQRPTPGIRTVLLDVLEPAEAVQLLAGLVGRARTERERQAATRLTELAGRHPLALRCVGERLAATPDLPLTTMVRRLGGAARRLDELSYGDQGVRVAYDAAYGLLSPLEQAVLRLLSLLPRTGFTAEAAAGMLGWEEVIAEGVIRRLVDHHLLSVVHPGGAEPWFVFPELAWLYAHDRLSALLTPGRLARPPAGAETGELPGFGEDGKVAG
ncbi:BTAD domain-containing putative transcriptional regulator [Streptomyces hygroscopicus]|uniref:AfsR/SARP family transcriptional regulator n=1 Tax=Streptomyces hygroscopicus TaxID=1912 RepID=UPI0036B199CC